VHDELGKKTYALGGSIKYKVAGIASVGNTLFDEDCSDIGKGDK
jgi:hypothetical protein